MAESNEVREDQMSEEAFDNDCKVRGLNANDESVVFTADTFLKKDFRGLAITTTDPGTSLNGDYFTADEPGDYTHFSLTGVKKSDWLIYNGTNWLLHARGLDQIPTDVRWYKDGSVIKLQIWVDPSWVDTGTEHPI
jgi:hypothetical protein